MIILILILGIMLVRILLRMLLLIFNSGTKRISENKGRNQQNKFGKHRGGFPKRAGQAHKTGINKQRRRYQKTAQNQKKNIRKQERENQKTDNQKTKKSLYDPKPSTNPTLTSRWFFYDLIFADVDQHEAQPGRGPFTHRFWPQTEK